MKEILEAYNLQAQEIEKLDAYASINYRVKSGGVNHLLKHYLDEDEYDLICEEDSILSLLSGKHLSFDLPASEFKLKKLPDGSFSRLLPFIEGELLSSVEQTDHLLRNFGEATGLLNRHLFSVSSAIIKARTLFWDMKHTLVNAEKASHIVNPSDRKLVAFFLDQFEQKVLPLQSKLRHCTIHSDLNDNNVIIEGEKVKGIIDFGDITYSPLIYEVAIAVTYLMLANESDAFEKASAFIKGYHNVFPLKKEEVKLLSILIPSRLCVSVCNSALKKTEGADTAYVLVSEKPAWHLLRRWISINPIWIDNFFLNALEMQGEELDSGKLKTKRKKFTSKSLGTSYNDPIYMTGAAFQYMYDHLGNTYLDAYNNIAHIGHCHPNISKIISQAVRKLNTNTRYIYPELGDYAEALAQTLPNKLHKMFYVNSGSAASDLAIRMARISSGFQMLAILENGYHGNTQVGIEISDYKHNGKGGAGKPDHIITLPLPKRFQGKFKTGRAYAEDAIQILESAITNGSRPAALIVEAISGCGGQVPLANEYLKVLKPFLEEHKILLIVDEVQTGFGRLGNHFWGFEMHDVVPDIVIMGKPMGNGHPIAAVITSPQIAESFANGMEFFTSFGGNPVSCSVALEVLKTIQEENLQVNAKVVGTYLKQELLQLKKSYECIADIRGEGLFIGIEFVNKQYETSKEIASYIKEDLKENFILVGTDGPHNNVIKIKPPLCFEMSNAEHFLEKLEIALKGAICKFVHS